MTETMPLHLSSTHLRLKPDASVEKLPVTPEFWPDLMAGKLGSFHHEYLVTLFSFTENWQSWENHRNGDEIVVLLSGEVEFVLETDTGEARQTLDTAGQFVFVPKNTWHTANVAEACSMLFITAGEGTEIRPR